MSDLFDKLKQGVSGISNNLPQGKAGRPVCSALPVSVAC